jgi:homoserine O-succinyltransferase
MLKIGVINNMPPAAIRSAERQFSEILTAAARDDIPFEIKWFRFIGVRPEHYGQMADLWESELDGLIVTGAEPKAAQLQDEPLWQPLTRTIEWAARHTTSAIWSCLAAHAAVLHLDGVERCPRDVKIFGVFDSIKSADHVIFANTEPVWRVPHSRWNDLPEQALDARGYKVLAKSHTAGVDTFIKQIERSLFVFIQSHPEYEAASLMREYQRDVTRFHLGQQDRYPNVPLNYFDTQIAARLEALRDDPSNQDEGRELLERVQMENSWKPVTIQVYRNWLGYLLEHSRTLAPLEHREDRPPNAVITGLDQAISRGTELR